MTARRSFLAMGAFAMAGNTPLVVQPMVVGAMVDRLGLTERQAGILASLEWFRLHREFFALPDDFSAQTLEFRWFELIAHA